MYVRTYVRRHVYVCAHLCMCMGGHRCLCVCASAVKYKIYFIYVLTAVAGHRINSPEKAFWSGTLTDLAGS